MELYYFDIREIRITVNEADHRMGSGNGDRLVRTKQQKIMEMLRSEIMEGRWSPGEQLPTRCKLEKRFGVSSITVQRALDRLSQQGFVFAEGRRGTFVSENPPHLSNYGLVFPWHAGDGHSWPRFWTAMEGQAGKFSSIRPDKRITSYYDALEASELSKRYHRLERAVRSHSLAGLIFCFTPTALRGSVLLSDPDLPRVGLLRGGAAVEGVLPIHLPEETFLDKALDHLADLGRQRVAMLTVPTVCASREATEHFRESAARRGMDTRPSWIQALSPSHPKWAHNYVQLLMDRKGTDRPDALIIANDNLVEHASAGLVAAGVRVPDELAVVAHCNFPWPTPSVLPVKRLGYDASELLDTCVTCLDAIRKGQTPSGDQRTVHARFEDERLSFSESPTRLSEAV